MNIKAEELKITIAYRLLHKRLQKGFGFDDGGFHNLRVFLINRVEQESGYTLDVELDGVDPDSVAKIRDREEYMKEKYGEDWR